MSVCRSCGASIVWAVTVNGKRMPVDAEPTPDGDLVLGPNPTGSADGYAPVVLHVAGQPSLFDEPDPARYRSHFATCPNADSHRKDRTT